MAQPQQAAVLAPGCHWTSTQEKCPQSPAAVASGAFSSLKTFQSHDQDGDWEERGAKQAASHPSSATGDPVLTSIPVWGHTQSDAMWGSHGSSPTLAHPWLLLQGAHPAPDPRWGIAAFRTLQNCANKNRSPRGAVWDSRTCSFLLGQGLLLPHKPH